MGSIGSHLRQHTLGYSLPGLTAASFGTSQVGLGKLTFSWNDPTLNGITVPDGTTVFMVRFNVVGAAGSNTSVAFVNSPTPLEFIDNTFVGIPFETLSGSISVPNVIDEIFMAGFE